MPWLMQAQPTEMGSARRKQRQLRARLSAARLGIDGTDFFQRQKRMTELVGFLAMEILAVAFILAIRKGGDDAGGSATTYLISMVPELRPPCPIQEDQGDVDQEEDYDQESYQ